MAPATGVKADKRQRTIAQMFGVKEPTSTTATTNKNTSASASPSTTSSSTRVTASIPKSSKSKTSNLKSSLITGGRLPQVSYQKLKPIDRESYLSSLSSEFKELLALELDPEHGLGSTYLHVLRSQLTQQYFLDLKRFLISQGLNQPRNDIFPTSKNIYNWSRVTPLDKIRVVIIGQDPYHGPGQAHGLSFSVPKGIPIPGSLRNIYQELKREYPEFKPPGFGTLTSWAESGVLLLNTSLTVKKASAGSHSNKGWEQFTDAVVDAIDLYGGLGLLENQPSTETGHTIEPVAKRIKLDHDPVSNEVTSVDQDKPVPSDSDPTSTMSVSDPSLTTSIPDAELAAPDLHHSKHTSPQAKTSADIPDNELASIEKNTAEHPVPVSSGENLEESNSESKPKEDVETTKSTEESTTQELPGFGKGVVFLCWGKWAADRVTRLSESKHLILKSAHPSPLSAHRGFLGNNHFTLANQWLEDKYGKSATINWCDLKP
ncbi:hypothetical protein MJO28_011541 [Puccinia striiformis f. sp. tritici]|uniref:Uncharacterized protein n=1 Tax=Puccinia striiformis f. sp. tritici TaxID=168172 RepID=A0ACC0E4C8_9BASI|nr:hypothetical protein Pst134EB_021974 [Puccinia striiformis f. sp. tritici]KAI7944013.1 hypothetical protein MJO28_011541 [Puccinia striiformis f. sp. tritici]